MPVPPGACFTGTAGCLPSHSRIETDQVTLSHAPAHLLTFEKEKPLPTFEKEKPLLLRSQVLVFVNSADAGMRVRLFLEAFGVRAAVLNAELPLNSRHHILQVEPLS